ncbi:TPA: restriction endonuclease subunit S [Vibrio cholerae]|nr:restriction endonuclease subunit S [Vibrio cholerae]
MRSKDVIDKALGVFSHFELFISKERYQEIKVKYGSPQKGDLLISSVGNRSGWPYIVQEEGDFYFKDGNVIWMSQFDGLDPDFLAYWLKSDIGQAALSSIMIGSAQKALTIDSLRKLWVRFPPFEYQHLSSNVLKLLDKKIAANKQTSQTLEEMAQAIFKSWFVDFDPVKAKMNGEQPEGMDAATASLFPEKLVESELGLIPDGWELTNIGKVSECFDKKRIPLSKRQREQKQGSIPYYGATSVMDYVDEAIFDDIYLLIGEDGSVMKDDGTPFIQYIWGPAWVNNHAHVLQGIKSVSTEQLMLFFQQTNINAYVTGAVQLKINQRNMNSIPFIKAPKEINERFYDVVAPLYAKIRAIKEENEQLAKLRDTLLPKLLSGEIELGETEEMGEVS